MIDALDAQDSEGILELIESASEFGLRVEYVPEGGRVNIFADCMPLTIAMGIPVSSGMRAKLGLIIRG